jgi:hypothetical protein
MSKWGKLKGALLIAASTLSALLLDGCLGGAIGKQVMQYVAIGSIFD